MPGHLQGCRSPSVSCQDCMKVFRGDEYKAHVSCVSEAEKYQGALYKGKVKNTFVVIFYCNFCLINKQNKQKQNINKQKQT